MATQKVYLFGRRPMRRPHDYFLYIPNTSGTASPFWLIAVNDACCIASKKTGNPQQGILG